MASQFCSSARIWTYFRFVRRRPPPTVHQRPNFTEADYHMHGWTEKDCSGQSILPGTSLQHTCSNATHTYHTPEPEWKPRPLAGGRCKLAVIKAHEPCLHPLTERPATLPRPLHYASVKKRESKQIKLVVRGRGRQAVQGRIPLPTRHGRGRDEV
jgi:hypothetical protein